MRDLGQELLPIFRSAAQQRILGWLLTDPSRHRPIRALSEIAGVSEPATLTEVNRLVESGLLSEERVGRARVVRANTASPFYRPLVAILELLHAPTAAVREEFKDVHGVQEAYIFGSLARRLNGQPGPRPNDIDVAVVGDQIDGRALRRAISNLQDRLDLPIDVLRVHPKEWQAATDPVLAAIQADNLINVAGDTDGHSEGASG